MPEGRDVNTTSGTGNRYPWFGIFRCFQIALDPRKLLVAALGIVVMSFAWWLLSLAFYYKAPSRGDSAYSNATIQRDLVDSKNPKTNDLYKEEDYRLMGDERYRTDLEQWKVLDSLAGPGGKLRTLPWNEYRGPNPYLLVTDVISGSAHDRELAISAFFTGSVPVLVEPLNKLLLPVAKLISPGTSPWTRFYLILILFCFIAVWAFCGGVITRLAAVQLANKGPMSLKQAIRFVSNRYLAYLGAPAVPLLIIAGIAIGLWIYGLIGLIPVFGDLFIYGIGLPVIIAAGAVMAIFLVGLVGYPLMYTTLSAEGDQSDTFDALSRSLNYVYQCPWYYIWYWLVAIAYGAAVTFFVLFFVSLTVYVGRWAAGLPASWFYESRKPEYLFIYTPESFGWRELLTKDSPYAVQGHWQPAEPPLNDRPVYRDLPVDDLAYQRMRADYYWYNVWGAGFVCFWITLMFLMMLGFAYSFFWSASTMIYFLMRKKVDESELDEVFIEEEEPLPPTSPKIAEGTGAAATSLPVISAPPAPPMVPPIVSSPPAPTVPPPLPPIPLVDGPPPVVSPPATILFSPPVTISEPTGKSVEDQKREMKPPSAE